MLLRHKRNAAQSIAARMHPIMMRPRVFSLATIVGLAIILSSPAEKLFAAPAANEYSKHFTALAQLSIAVAEAMPADKYGFKPHPESMTFGALMSPTADTKGDELAVLLPQMRLDLQPG